MSVSTGGTDAASTSAAEARSRARARRKRAAAERQARMAAVETVTAEYGPMSLARWSTPEVQDRLAELRAVMDPATEVETRHEPVDIPDNAPDLDS